MKLEGKRILITGGGSSIGLELARRLAPAPARAHDYKVYEDTREAKRLDEHLAAGAPSTIPR